MTTGERYKYVEAYADSKEYKRIIVKYLTTQKARNPEKNIADKIILALKQGIKQGKNINSISRDINKIVDNKQKSELIAKTVVLAENMGSIERDKARGAKKHEWVTGAIDSRTCTGCRERDGKIFSYKEIKKLKRHSGCRCSTVGVY